MRTKVLGQLNYGTPSQSRTWCGVTPDTPQWNETSVPRLKNFNSIFECFKFQVQPFLRERGTKDYTIGTHPFNFREDSEEVTKQKLEEQNIQGTATLNDLTIQKCRALAFLIRMFVSPGNRLFLVTASHGTVTFRSCDATRLSKSASIKAVGTRLHTWKKMLLRWVMQKLLHKIHTSGKIAQTELEKWWHQQCQNSDNKCKILQSRLDSLSHLEPSRPRSKINLNWLAHGSRMKTFNSLRRWQTCLLGFQCWHEHHLLVQQEDEPVRVQSTSHDGRCIEFHITLSNEEDGKLYGLICVKSFLILNFCPNSHDVVCMLPFFINKDPF